jgi:hypothetical protein
MNDKRLGGIALILGALFGILVLTFHPGGGHRVTPAQLEALIAMSIGVHAVAIASLPISFLGTLALSRQFASPARLTLIALVIYGFSLVATMSAATMSGLVTPGVLRHMVTHDAAAEQWHILLSYTHTINQAFAQIGAVGTCLAIILWSIAILQGRPLHLVIGAYGVLLGLAAIGALFSGALDLELHGFRIITLGESIWFILAAVLLLRSNKISGPEVAHL